MSIKDIVCKFNYEISKFAKRKSEFCNCPGRDFSRNRKQNFESVIRSILSLNILGHYARNISGCCCTEISKSE